MTTFWEQHHCEERITAILNDVTYVPKPEHHFGRPYLSAYQLAIEFKQRYRDSFDAIAYKPQA